MQDNHYKMTGVKGEAEDWPPHSTRCVLYDSTMKNTCWTVVGYKAGGLKFHLTKPPVGPLLSHQLPQNISAGVLPFLAVQIGRSFYHCLYANPIPNNPSSYHYSYNLFQSVYQQNICLDVIVYKGFGTQTGKNKWITRILFRAYYFKIPHNFSQS